MYKKNMCLLYYKTEYQINQKINAFFSLIAGCLAISTEKLHKKDWFYSVNWSMISY